MPRKVYKNAPIDEALCEFRFVAKKPWNLTVPGRIFDELKGEYGGPPQNVVQDQIAVPTNPVAPQLVALNRSLSVRLSDEKATRALTIGPDLLVVHALRPYPTEGWGGFRPRIDAALQAYSRVAEPAVVQRIGVRYINRLDLSGATAELDKAFTAPPPAMPVPGLSSQTPLGFMQRSEHRYDEQTRLIVLIARVDDEAGKPAFVLDLDVIWQDAANPCPVSDAMSLTDRLHGLEGEAFEALLTSDYKRSFDD